MYRPPLLPFPPIELYSFRERFGNVAGIHSPRVAIYARYDAVRQIRVDVAILVPSINFIGGWLTYGSIVAVFRKKSPGYANDPIGNRNYLAIHRNNPHYHLRHPTRLQQHN